MLRWRIRRRHKKNPPKSSNTSTSTTTTTATPVLEPPESPTEALARTSLTPRVDTAPASASTRDDGDGLLVAANVVTAGPAGVGVEGAVVGAVLVRNSTSAVVRRGVVLQRVDRGEVSCAALVAKDGDVITTVDDALGCVSTTLDKASIVVGVVGIAVGAVESAAAHAFR